MGTYSYSEFVETFGGPPERGETYPDDPDALRDRLDEERACGQSLYVAGQPVGACDEPFGTEHDHETVVRRIERDRADRAASAELLDRCGNDFAPDDPEAP